MKADDLHKANKLMDDLTEVGEIIEVVKDKKVIAEGNNFINFAVANKHKSDSMGGHEYTNALTLVVQVENKNKITVRLPNSEYSKIVESLRITLEAQEAEYRRELDKIGVEVGKE